MNRSSYFANLSALAYKDFDKALKTKLKELIREMISIGDTMDELPPEIDKLFSLI